MAYEWSKHAKAIKQSEAQKQNPATQKDIQGFLSRLKFDLDENNFFRSKDLKQTMIRNIENIFVRNDLTHQEVKTLHGILSALRGNKSPK